MEKTKKEAGTETDPTAAPQAATRPEETEEKGGQKGGTDAEEPEDPGLDQGGEAPATGSERFSDEVLNQIEESAKKVFASNNVDRLWFTADGCGFGNEADASAHADTLRNKRLLEINRKDLD